jgi:hypothetical protein
MFQPIPPPHGSIGDPAMATVIFFVFGPLLLLSVLICADARGGTALAVRIGGPSEGGLRYLSIAAFVVTVVGVLLSMAR